MRSEDLASTCQAAAGEHDVVDEAAEEEEAAAARSRRETPAALQSPAKRRPEGVPLTELGFALPARAPGGAFGSSEVAATLPAASPAASTPLLAAQSKEEPGVRPPAEGKLLGTGPKGTSAPLSGGAPCTPLGAQLSRTKRIQANQRPGDPAVLAVLRIPSRLR